MKMTVEERQQRMAERNQAICAYYLEGHTLAECGKQFGLKRQRIKQIVQAAKIWRERTPSTNDRDKFLGINISEEDKATIKEEASRQGISMSAMTAEWIKERLEELRQQREVPDAENAPAATVEPTPE